MIYDFLTENDGNELYNKVQQYIDELKQQGINYIIILDHFGNEGTESTKYTSSILLSHISGVNAMLDGHTHKEYNFFILELFLKFIIIIPAKIKMEKIFIYLRLEQNFLI